MSSPPPPPPPLSPPPPPSPTLPQPSAPPAPSPTYPNTRINNNKPSFGRSLSAGAGAGTGATNTPPTNTSNTTSPGGVAGRGSSIRSLNVAAGSGGGGGTGGAGGGGAGAGNPSCSGRFQAPRLPRRSGKNANINNSTAMNNPITVTTAVPSHLRPPPLVFPPSPATEEANTADSTSASTAAPAPANRGGGPSILQLGDQFDTPPTTPRGGDNNDQGDAGWPKQNQRGRSQQQLSRGGSKAFGGQKNGSNRNLGKQGGAPKYIGLRKQYPALTECGFAIRHPLRLRAVLLVDAIGWDAWILVMVLFNAMCLAFSRPTDTSSPSLTMIIQFFEILCQICFTYEAVVKFVALGLARYKLSYFRDPWNVFDFIVLIAGWLAIYATWSTPSQVYGGGAIRGPLTVFGVIRVLRPFRILKMLPELQRLTGAVVLALPQLLTLMSLALLVFATLAVIGLNLLSGELHQQCYKPLGNYYEDNGSTLKLCTTSTRNHGGRQCPTDYICKASPATPNYGFTSFDNAGLAFLTIFQCMTQQGWSDIMYWSRQAAGDYMFAYFNVILFLSFFLFNLIIVFIIVNYSLSQEQSTVESIKDGNMVAPLGVAPPPPGIPTSSASAVTPLSFTDDADVDSLAAATATRRPSSDYSELLISKLLTIKAGAKLEALTDASSEAKPLLAGEKNDRGTHTQEQQKQAASGVSTSNRIAEVGLLLQRAMRHLQLAPQNTFGPNYFRLPSGEGGGSESISMSSEGESDAASELDPDRQSFGMPRQKDPSKVTFEESPGTFICAALARSPSFYHFMNAMTLLSTILLSLAHYGMSDDMASTLTRLNNLLVLVFTVEAFIKIKGLGWRRFKADGMNTFDLLVVIVSILELFLGGNTARSYALRCVRLLRVFSLARNWRSFRRVLSNMAYTASNSLPFLLLTTIFLSVFAIGGMTFLAGKLTETDPKTGLQLPARANFDSFYWSLISVFQIMTLDQWNTNMYDAMAGADAALAAAFYVSAVLLGKYVLLNLLTAILVENYSLLQADEDGRRALKRDNSALGNMQTPFAFLRRYLPYTTQSTGGTPSMRLAGPPSLLLKQGSDQGSSSNVTATTQKQQSLGSSNISLWALMERLTGKPRPPSSFMRVDSLQGGAAESARQLAVGEMGEKKDMNNKNSSNSDAPPPSGAGGGAGGAGGAAVAVRTSSTLGKSFQTMPSLDEETLAGMEDKRRSGKAMALCHRFCCSSSSCCHALGDKLQVIDNYFLRVYEHEWFPVVMVVTILASCIILGMDCPGPDGLGPTQSYRFIIQICEGIFLCVITFEQVYRIKSLGGIWTYDGSYLTRLWDWFDLFVILSCLVALCMPYSAALRRSPGFATAVMAAKTARGFRPITLIPRINGLTVVADTLCQALQACSGVLSVLAVFYLLFGILGVSLFSGGFHSCNDPERTCYGPDLSNTMGGAGGVTTTGGASFTPAGFSCPTTLSCTGKYYDLNTATMTDREWLNPTFSPEGSPFSFDSLPNALLTLFEVASLEMWGMIMFQACDVVGPGQAPIRNANPAAAVYFVSFLFIVCFFVQEIFVAVIIDNFKRLKRISNGSAFMTSQQKEWVRLQKTVKSLHPRIHLPPSPSQYIRYRLHKLVHHRFFEPFVTFLVLVNVVLMLTTHYPRSEGRYLFDYTVDSLFTFIYLVEALLRIAALGLVSYLTSSKWNDYDALVTTWGLFVFCLGPIAQGSIFCLLTLRVGRTVRIFRIIRHSSHLRRLCRTFYFSLPSLKNIGMFLCLIYYIYAVGGMHLFSQLPRGTFINEDANFSSFGLSLLTLLRCTAGESWNGLMHEADKATAKTRGKMAILYFCSFMVLITYVALNLFIATMLENFQEDMASSVSLVTTKHIRTFSRLWTELKKKSLRGDLTKINNRTTTVTTATMKRDATALLAKKRKSMRSLAVVAASPPATGNNENMSVSTPTTATSPLPGTPAAGDGAGDEGATAGTPTATAATTPSLSPGGGKRRVSLRERLDSVLKATSSARALTAKKGGAGASVDKPRKSTRAVIKLKSEDQDHDQDQQGQDEDEESLIFMRLYESSPRYLPIQYLKTFVTQLPAPLGPKGCFEGKAITPARVLEYIRSLEVPVNNFEYVYYQDVLQAVLRRAFELQTHIPEDMRLPFKNKQVFLAHEWYAAVAVQSVWRGGSLRSKLSSSPKRNNMAVPAATSGAASAPSSSPSAVVALTPSPSNRLSVSGDRPSPNISLKRSPQAGQHSPLSSSSSGRPVSVSIHEAYLPPPPASPSHHKRRSTSSSNGSMASVSLGDSGGREQRQQQQQQQQQQQMEMEGEGKLESGFLSRAGAGSPRHAPLSPPRQRGPSSAAVVIPAPDDMQQQQQQHVRARSASQEADMVAKMFVLQKLGEELLPASPRIRGLSRGDASEVDLRLLEKELMNRREQRQQKEREDEEAQTAAAAAAAITGTATAEEEIEKGEEEGEGEETQLIVVSSPVASQPPADMETDIWAEAEAGTGEEVGREDQV